MASELPFVHIVWTQTVDGRIGAEAGDVARQELDRLKEEAEQVVTEMPERYTGSLRAMLEELGSRQVGSILVTGTAELITSFLREGVWDTVSIYIAPSIAGSAGESLGWLGTEQLDEVPRLQRRSWRRVGSDVCVTGYRTGE